MVYSVINTEKDLPPFIMFTGPCSISEPKKMLVDLYISKEAVGRLQHEGISEVHSCRIPVISFKLVNKFVVFFIKVLVRFNFNLLLHNIEDTILLRSRIKTVKFCRSARQH